MAAGIKIVNDFLSVVKLTMFFVVCMALYLLGQVRPPTVGWSDLALLSIFENGHLAADQLYFNEFNSN